MQANDDLWLLVVNLGIRLSQQGDTEAKRQQTMLTVLRSMAPPTRNIMRHHIRSIVAELGAVEKAMSETES